MRTNKQLNNLIVSVIIFLHYTWTCCGEYLHYMWVISWAYRGLWLSLIKRLLSASLVPGSAPLHNRVSALRISVTWTNVRFLNETSPVGVLSKIPVNKVPDMMLTSQLPILVSVSSSWFVGNLPRQTTHNFSSLRTLRSTLVCCSQRDFNEVNVAVYGLKW